jgi:hypothetical protein
LIRENKPDIQTIEKLNAPHVTSNMAKIGKLNKEITALNVYAKPENQSKHDEIKKEIEEIKKDLNPITVESYWSEQCNQKIHNWTKKIYEAAKTKKQVFIVFDNLCSFFSKASLFEGNKEYDMRIDKMAMINLIVSLVNEPGIPNVFAIFNENTDDIETAQTSMGQAAGAFIKRIVAQGEGSFMVKIDLALSSSMLRTTIPNVELEDGYVFFSHRSKQEIVRYCCLSS